jgi:hypothetical protein
MNICKNCGTEFDGRYCNFCGQKFIEKHTLKSVIKDFTVSFNVNNRFFATLKGIFLTPRKLNDDYHEGTTHRYIGPFAIMFIVVSLFYVLSESKILGFSIITTENEFYFFYKNIRTPLLAGLISGLLPFTAYNWIKYMSLSFYLSSGFLLLMLLGQIASGFEWIYEASDFFSQAVFYLTVVYLVYYNFSVFKGHYRSLLIFIFLFISIEAFYEDVEYYIVNVFEDIPEHQSDALDDLYYNHDLPDWSYDKLITSSEHYYVSNILGDNSYFKNDVDKDGVRDISAFLSDTLSFDYLLSVSIKDDLAKTISLNDLFGINKNVHLVSVSSFNDPDKLFTVLYSDSTVYNIYWKENEFYGKKSQ